MAEVRGALRQALDRDRAALGDDMYGAELAGRLPGIEEGLFAAFDAYLTELDGTSEDLTRAAITYESAEHPGWAGYGNAGDPSPRTSRR
ncbi:hypothetical protein [Nonomuraea sp. NPDC002799]